VEQLRENLAGEISTNKRMGKEKRREKKDLRDPSPREKTRRMRVLDREVAPEGVMQKGHRGGEEGRNIRY